MTEAAQTASRLVHGNCPAPQPPREECSVTNPTGHMVRELQNVGAETEETIWLSRLAGCRADALDCAKKQLVALDKDDAEFEKYAADMHTKIELLAYHHKKIKTLEMRMAEVRATPEPGLGAELRKEVAAMQATMNSIPHIELPQIQRAVHQQLMRLSGGVLGQPPQTSPELEKRFRQILRAQLRAATASVDEDARAMRMGHVLTQTKLDRSQRESLAQDLDLVESCRAANPGQHDDSTVCRVDEKYGRGANYRDIGITVALFAATGLSTALVKGAATLMTIPNFVRTGGITMRGAAIIRAAATAADVSVTLAQANAACGNRPSNFTGTIGRGNTCDEKPLRTLEHDNCVLSTALAAIGAKSLLDAGAAKVVARLANRPPPMEIPSRFRPSSLIPDSGRAVDANEVRAAGKILTSPEEVKRMVDSGELRDGTFVMLVVRDRQGRDHLLLENRIPTGKALDEERYVSHRSLRQKWRDTYGEDPKVVGAGECNINGAGLLVGCINRSGSYHDGNTSPDYLMDVAEAYGFRRDAHTARKAFDAKVANAEIGHFNAVQEMQWARMSREAEPGLLEATRENLRKLYREHGADNSSGLDMTWTKKAIKLGIRPDPSMPAEKAQAYKNIFMIIQGSREGSVPALGRVIERIREESKNPQAEFAAIRKYFPDFIRDAASP